MSVTGNRKTTIGLDHSGAPHAGSFVPVGHPAAMASHPHAVPSRAGMVDHTNVHADLGKQPKPKRALTTSPPIAGGMTAKSRRTGEHFHNIGGQDLSRFDAAGPDPLAGPPAGKRLSPVKIAPTMRSRTSPGLTNDLHVQLGRAILDEARNASSVDDRLYGVGSLPSRTTEN